MDTAANEAPPPTEAAPPRVKDPTPRIKVHERDIIQLAYGKCATCDGTGYIVFVRQMMAKKGAVKYRNAKGEPTAWYSKDTKLPVVHPIQNRFGMVNEKSGKVNFVRRSVDPSERDKEVCKCAISRFIRLQATDMDPATGELYFAEPIGYMTKETKEAHEAIIKSIAERAVGPTVGPAVGHELTGKAEHNVDGDRLRESADAGRGRGDGAKETGEEAAGPSGGRTGEGPTTA